MKRNRLGSCVIAVGLAALTASTPALAGVEITATEVGGDVIFEGGGTLDFSLWTYYSRGQRSTAVWPIGSLEIGPQNQIFHVYREPVNLSGPDSIGPGTEYVRASTGEGDVFGLRWIGTEGWFEALFVPFEYTSGDPLNGSSTFWNHTFDSLGVTEGVYHWTWDTADGEGDFFTINIVPAPGTIALLGLAGLIGKRRRRIA